MLSDFDFNVGFNLQFHTCSKGQEKHDIHGVWFSLDKSLTWQLNTCQSTWQEKKKTLPTTNCRGVFSVIMCQNRSLKSPRGTKETFKIKFNLAAAPVICYIISLNRVISVSHWYNNGLQTIPCCHFATSRYGSNENNSRLWHLCQLMKSATRITLSLETITVNA